MSREMQLRVGRALLRAADCAFGAAVLALITWILQRDMYWAYVFTVFIALIVALAGTVFIVTDDEG